MCTGAVAGFVAASMPGWTIGAGAVFGATMKVCSLKRPTKFLVALPSLSVVRSPWYQDNPKGALGTWMTNRSNSVFLGNPDREHGRSVNPVSVAQCGIQPLSAKGRI